MDTTKVEITYLGTGTSQGVPVIACKCPVCQSLDFRDSRLRSSVMMRCKDKTLVIDTGPDFRQQMLRERVEMVDAIILTHAHKDHIAGLDDIRAFNYLMKKPMDVYAELNVQSALRREYAYVFAEEHYPGIPEMNLHTIQNEKFTIDELEILPIRAMHHKLPILGFRIGEFAYITDANFIADEEKDKIRNIKVLTINALRKRKHISHFSLSEALTLIDEVKPQQAYLTHISHLMGFHAEIEKELPTNVLLAFDGLQIEV